MVRNIVITGCNRGIGLELARLYRQQNDHVIGLVRQSSSELLDLGVEVVEGFDVCSPLSNLAELTDSLKEVDMLINNAGIFEQESWPFKEEDLEAIRRQIEVNTLGPLKVASVLAPAMKKGSLMAFTSSRMGSISDNTGGSYYGYRMSKAALNMAVKGLAVDLKPQGIWSVALHPGYVKTRMTGFQGEIETPESALGLFKILENMNEQKSGTFWHSNAEELAW